MLVVHNSLSVENQKENECRIAYFGKIKETIMGFIWHLLLSQA